MHVHRFAGSQPAPPLLPALSSEKATGPAIGPAGRANPFAGCSAPLCMGSRLAGAQTVVRLWRQSSRAANAAAANAAWEGTAVGNAAVAAQTGASSTMCVL